MINIPFVSRINQLDAVQLDDEIYKVLRAQTDQITQYFGPGKSEKWRPEINVLVKYLIWYYSLKTNSSSFGQRLLNLSYTNLDKRKSVLLFVFLTLPDYLRNRLLNENFILSKLAPTYTTSKYKKYVEQVDNFFNLLNFIWNFFFLHLGNQPRYVEKILGIYNQSSKMNKPRSIGYSYMTRELLWHGLIELFTISIPMIDFRNIQKLWNNLWLSRKEKHNVLMSCKLQPNALCSYCKQSPILPRWAGCIHVFCYYCLEALFITMDPYQCPICNLELYSADINIYLNI